MIARRAIGDATAIDIRQPLKFIFIIIVFKEENPSYQSQIEALKKASSECEENLQSLFKIPFIANKPIFPQDLTSELEAKEKEIQVLKNQLELSNKISADIEKAHQNNKKFLIVEKKKSPENEAETQKLSEKFEKKVKEMEKKHQEMIKNLNSATKSKENEYIVTISKIAEENEALNKNEKKLEGNINDLKEDLTSKLEAKEKEIKLLRDQLELSNKISADFEKAQQNNQKSRKDEEKIKILEAKTQKLLKEFEKKVKEMEEKHQEMIENLIFETKTMENEYIVTINGITDENETLKENVMKLEENINDLTVENENFFEEITENNKKFDEIIKENHDKIEQNIMENNKNEEENEKIIKEIEEKYQNLQKILNSETEKKLNEYRETIKEITCKNETLLQKERILEENQETLRDGLFIIFLRFVDYFFFKKMRNFCMRKSRFYLEKKRNYSRNWRHYQEMKKNSKRK